MSRPICGMCGANEVPPGWSFIMWCDRCLKLGNLIKRAAPGISLEETCELIKAIVSRDTNPS